jgi:hypothetical protein
MASIVVAGDTSGTVTLAAPAVSGTTTLTLPTTSGTIVTTSGSQTIEFADGSASTPSITNSGDTNTGMFFPAADTIAFAEGGTEAMRLDSSGNVGIGTTSPANKFEVFGNSVRNTARASSTAGSVQIEAQAFDYWSTPTYTGTSLLQYGSTATGTIAGLSNAGLGQLLFQNGTAGLIYTNGGAPLVFGTASAERMRIDSSGNLLVSTTTTTGNGAAFQVAGSGGGMMLRIAKASEGTAHQFVVNSSVVGTIYAAPSSTSYNTSSDYRLKENIAPMTGALNVVQQLKPVTYNWKVDGSDGQGFIAHELQEVVPDCVVGDKDAVDEDGNPKYQGVDTSFLVATLTAAIQEQQTIIETLKADIAELKAKVK